MIRESFNPNWFYRREEAGVETPLTGPITLPHDAMLLEKRGPQVRNAFNTGYFPGGAYHYVKTFFAPAEWRDRHVVFEFEGVYMDSTVFINRQRAGGWPYGYTSFTVSADGLLQYGQENQVEVLVHNDREPNSRWYSGSGIYRNVNLLVGSRVYILPAGVKITTREVQGQQARVEVAVTLASQEKQARSARLLIEFHAPNGELTASSEALVTLQPGETVTLRQDLAVQNTALWSMDHPNLYTAFIKIMSGESVMDEDRATFGIRVLALDSRNGLRINGEPVKLRGGCVHHDNGVIGACTLEAAEDRRVRILKASGFNAIRSAHNPMSRAMLDACDRRGVLVMDELSDVWLRPKTPYDYSLYFRDWWERDLQSMVDKDYNHPSVIFYSIGNEIRETATPEGVDYSRRLASHVKSLDPTRFVINSVNGWYSLLAALGLGERKVKKTPADGEKTTHSFINPFMNFANRFMDWIVSLPGIDQRTHDAFAAADVAGYNYMAGRYAQDGRRHPDRVICGSETFPPEIAKNWRLVKRLPHVIGDFSWAGWDYLGEAGLCTWQYGKNQALYKPYPCILADSALIDITGHRQTQSYIHEIVWGLRKEPYIAVQPVNHSGESLSKSVWRGTNSISSWSWDGCEGRRAVVEVYAAADQVELLLNGQSQGKKPAGDAHGFKAVFRLPYQPGELTAVSYSGDAKEIARTTLRTASPQLHLHVQSEAEKLRANGADLAHINILLADEAGIVKPLADRPVTVHVEGAGSLQGFGSANPLTEESFTAETHTTYHSRALAVVRAGLQPGTICVTISAEGCETKQITIPVE
jgi:beta-galactosidase